jgi:CBS domain-containing protein
MPRQRLDNRPASSRQLGRSTPVRHDLDLSSYLDELTEIRSEAQQNLGAAGERALKTLDRFLGDLARALGMPDERPGMGDSLRHLEHQPGTARAIAAEADRYRDTRNALAHNPDLMLRPEAATRVIAGVERVIRMAAETVFDLARHRVVMVAASEPLTVARDRMLSRDYNQLVVVDDRGGLLDLLTERDLVVSDAPDGHGGAMVSVADVITERGHAAVAVLPVSASVAEAVDALRDERVGAVVLTERGGLGEPPRGIVTRSDVLQLL